MQTLPNETTMYQALVDRDTSYDGVFLVAVKTTGIFCRPVCVAKKPQRHNVEFFRNAQQALCAGYRPCKRCRPMDHHRKPPAWVRRLMDAVDQSPSERFTDASLRSLAIEPARARRYFKEHYGMTSTRTTVHAAWAWPWPPSAAGTTSTPSACVTASTRQRLPRRVARMFGCPPGRGRKLEYLTARWLDTPLGAVLAITSDDGLCLLEFVDRRALERQISTLRRRMKAEVVPGNHRHLDTIADELTRYFAGSLSRFEVPLALSGSPFQMRVWQRLQRIPHGETLSYAQLAQDIGHPGAQRAVGRANGDNRLAIVVPCHRVVRSDGTLCGYGGGLWRKKWLLEHEQAAFTR